MTSARSGTSIDTPLRAARRLVGSPLRSSTGTLRAGLRVELTLPQRCPGLSGTSLLMLRPDGQWEVFGDDGLLATYDADAVRVSISGTDALEAREHVPTLLQFRSDGASSMNRRMGTRSDRGHFPTSA